MTDSTSTADAPRRKKGPGSGKVAPAVVVNGSNFEEYFPLPPPKKGAPTTYTKEMADRICAWKAEGRTLSSFCKLDGTPELQTVYNWQDAHPDFFEKYARATDRGMDVLAELAVDEASIASLPPERVQAARLAFDARRWYASKIAPRRYGEKLDLKAELTGPGGGPIQVEMLLNGLLTPANLERLTDIEVESIRSAAAKLALPPAASAAPPTIDADYTDVPPDGAGDG
jgi:hypothetical protein